LAIDKTLTLNGYGSGTKTINGNDIYKHTIEINADDVYISGFTIQNNVGLSNHKSNIFLSSSTGCIITDNIIKNADSGIYLSSSSSNTIYDNTIEDNSAHGLVISSSSSNDIHGNMIQDNGNYGVYLSSGSSNNEIYENNIQENNGYGLRTVSSSGNIIYKNYFSDNGGGNANDPGSNSWSYSSQGNYWDDYTGVDNFHGPNQDIPGPDGIGDTPYSIPGGSNQDLYPLVNQTPTADAGGPYSGYINDEITFDASNSNDPDGNIVGYQWDWTNDDTYDTNWLTTSTATHSYSAAETYTVKLQVKDNSGATDVDTTQVTVTAVIQKPTATIVKPDPSTTTTATHGESVEFHGYGIPSEGIIIGKSWRSSIDGFVSSEYTFTKSNLSVGTHIIYFKVKDSNGWSDEVSTDLVIEPSSPSLNEPPVADPGGPYTGYVNVSISFNASGSYDPDGDEIVSYVWNFGDGTNGTGMSIEHTYNSTGNHTVNLTITDSKGNSSTISTYANVSIQPTDQNGNGSGIDGENDKTPGFEIILIFIAVVVLLILKKH
jgi:parallel beta-helix repeat protein